MKKMYGYYRTDGPPMTLGNAAAARVRFIRVRDRELVVMAF